MGNNFSAKQEIYVNDVSNPRVRECTRTLSIRGVVVPGEELLAISGGANPFASLVTSKDENQSAVILGIYTKYIRNETNCDVTFNVSNLFASKSTNEDVNHVDDNGKLKILCPARYDGAVEGNDSLIYRPRLRNNILLTYCGVEENLLSTEEHVLHVTHPIVRFIRENKKLLEPESSDFVELEKNSFQIDPTFLEKTKRFFKNTIYDDIHRTRFEGTLVECKVPKLEQISDPALYPNITCIIQVDYILV